MCLLSAFHIDWLPVAVSFVGSDTRDAQLFALCRILDSLVDLADKLDKDHGANSDTASTFKLDLAAIRRATSSDPLSKLMVGVFLQQRFLPSRAIIVSFCSCTFQLPEDTVII